MVAAKSPASGGLGPGVRRAKTAKARLPGLDQQCQFATNHHSRNMSITATPESARQSPKRKRSESLDASTPQLDGAADGPDLTLQYAYDDEMPSELRTPEDDQDGETAKRRKVERPKRLDYVPYMTLRGHKRGVAAVKYSPDGKWIASCCT